MFEIDDPQLVENVKSNNSEFKKYVSSKSLSDTQLSLYDEKDLLVFAPCSRVLEFALNKIKASGPTNQKLLIVLKCVDTGVTFDSNRIFQILDFDREKALSTVILSRCILKSGTALAQTTLLNTIDDLFLEDECLPYIKGFNLLEAVFHISAEIGGFVFDNLKVDFTSPKFTSEKVVISAMSALSTVCVNKQCREKVTASYIGLVETAFVSHSAEVKLLAASVLVKCKAGTGSSKKEDVEFVTELSLLFEDYVASIADKGECTEKNKLDLLSAALEGLAYTSMLVEVKKRIQPVVLIKLLKVFIGNAPIVYCILSVLSNYTRYPTIQTQEQKKVQQLRNYSAPDAVSDQREETSVIDKRCEEVCNLGIVGIISNNIKGFTGLSQDSIASLLRNLATNQSLRKIITSQGGIAVLIYISLENTSSLVAPSGLAKTLISTNPAVAFSSKISPLSAVTVLARLLDSDFVLDQFESLLALTNLASYSEECRHSIIQKCWGHLENYFTATNVMLQRACLELICNLAMSPHMAEKFLDGSRAANTRLELLAILTNVDDEKARNAAAGALAILSEWGPAPDVFIALPKVCEKLVDLLSEENSTDLCVRGLVCLDNVSANGQWSTSVAWPQTRLEELSKIGKKSPEICELASELAKRKI